MQLKLKFWRRFEKFHTFFWRSSFMFCVASEMRIFVQIPIALSHPSEQASSDDFVRKAAWIFIIQCLRAALGWAVMSDLCVASTSSSSFERPPSVAITCQRIKDHSSFHFLPTSHRPEVCVQLGVIMIDELGKKERCRRWLLDWRKHLGSQTGVYCCWFWGRSLQLVWFERGTELEPPAFWFHLGFLS